nr:longitudinals lacking protein, isoforms A/B/D/L-like [Megalopta genalis]
MTTLPYMAAATPERRRRRYTAAGLMPPRNTASRDLAGKGWSFHRGLKGAYDYGDRNRHPCPKCFRSYKHRSHMIRHYKYECGTPQRFECPYCKHHLRQRTHVWTHIRTFHPNSELYCVDIATNARLTHQEHRTDNIGPGTYL